VNDEAEQPDEHTLIEFCQQTQSEAVLQEIKRNTPFLGNMSELRFNKNPDLWTSVVLAARNLILHARPINRVYTQYRENQRDSRNEMLVHHLRLFLPLTDASWDGDDNKAEQDRTRYALLVAFVTFELAVRVETIATSVGDRGGVDWAERKVARSAIMVLDHTVSGANFKEQIVREGKSKKCSPDEILSLFSIFGKSFDALGRPNFSAIVASAVGTTATGEFLKDFIEKWNRTFDDIDALFSKFGSHHQCQAIFNSTIEEFRKSIS